MRAGLKQVRRVMIRTGAGPLRRLWALVYRLIIAGSVAWLRRISPDSTIYIRGGFARGDAAYGLSDVDLVAVAVDGREADLRDRIRNLYSRLPLTKDIVEFCVYSRSGYRRATTAPFLAWPAGPPEHLASAASLPTGGPRVVGPLRDWRRLAGPKLLSGRPSDCSYASLWGWMEVQFVWKHAFRLCAEPTGVHVGRNLVKSATDLARVLLWLEHGEVVDMGSVLSRFRAVYPEEAELAETISRLQKSLHLQPAPPLSEVLAFVVRCSRGIADRIDREAERAGAVRVRLRGNWSPETLPLLDWRARTLPGPPEESFIVMGHGISDVSAIGAAARLESSRSPYPALASDGLLLLPTNRRAVQPHSPAAFRAAQSAATDPVSFALLAGHRVARFPELPGWAIGHAASRSVAEFAHWFETAHTNEPLLRLGVLFSAARAALLWESLEAGAPELAVTLEAIAESLGPSAQTALEIYRDRRITGSNLQGKDLRSFERAVRSLRAYRRPSASASNPSSTLETQPTAGSVSW
ncbi:MAG: hypothetical protein GC160_16695 [Acidobacteria bacterium]|nr:hypothetical protein [Acidobacteriota bacterium]